jgi:hypothetical protein
MTVIITMAMLGCVWIGYLFGHQAGVESIKAWKRWS